jgi:hypothetical protein
MLRVEDKPCIMIMGSQDLQEAWEKLDKTYRTRMVNNRTTLMSELICMHYNGSGILEHKGWML